MAYISIRGVFTDFSDVPCQPASALDVIWPFFLSKIGRLEVAKALFRPSENPGLQ